MDGTNGLKETTRVTAPIASNTLSVNIFTAPGKVMVGEPLGFDSITSTLIYGGDTFTLEGPRIAHHRAGPHRLSRFDVSARSINRPDRRWRRCVQPMPHVRRRHHPRRNNWIAALDRLAALNQAIVVAGHKKPGAPDSPSTIQDTKRYLQDFKRLQKTATSDRELFDQMTALYPHWVAKLSWLMFGFPGA